MGMPALAMLRRCDHHQGGGGMQRVFGRLDDGSEVHALTLRSDAGLAAEVLSFGGILRRLTLEVDGRPLSLVLGLPDLPAYLTDRDNLGILVGRYGNRIAHGRFSLDGQQYQLDRNEGDNHLHGGRGGFGRRLWDIEALDVASVRLALRSPAGDQGYPGNVQVSATLRLHGHCLELCYRARTDAPTPFNLTHHPYFNLAGDPTVPAAQQRLQVPAERYLPVDAALIPTGTLAAVAATPFDFRVATSFDERRVAGDPQLALGHGYDHCLLLQAAHDYSAELYSPHSGVALRIVSPMPALQVYEGQMLDRGHPGLGRGVCLEPQQCPDAPNQPAFPPAILRPGEEYVHRIEYRFAPAGRDAGRDAVRAALDAALR
jgi:aldose 1-epimerase